MPRPSRRVEIRLPLGQVFHANRQALHDRPQRVGGAAGRDAELFLEGKEKSPGSSTTPPQRIMPVSDRSATSSGWHCSITLLMPLSTAVSGLQHSRTSSLVMTAFRGTLLTMSEPRTSYGQFLRKRNALPIRVRQPAARGFRHAGARRLRHRRARVAGGVLGVADMGSTALARPLAGARRGAAGDDAPVVPEGLRRPQPRSDFAQPAAVRVDRGGGSGRTLHAGGMAPAAGEPAPQRQRLSARSVSAASGRRAARVP